MIMNFMAPQICSSPSLPRNWFMDSLIFCILCGYSCPFVERSLCFIFHMNPAGLILFVVRLCWILVWPDPRQCSLLFTHFALISSSRSTGSCFLPELWLISRNTTLLYLLSICRFAAISLAPLFFWFFSDNTISFFFILSLGHGTWCRSRFWFDSWNNMLLLCYSTSQSQFLVLVF